MALSVRLLDLTWFIFHDSFHRNAATDVALGPASSNTPHNTVSTVRTENEMSNFVDISQQISSKSFSSATSPRIKAHGHRCQAF